MNRLLILSTVLVMVCLTPGLRADVALPGDGGGDSNSPGPPPSGAPTTPSLAPPQAGTNVNNLRNSLDNVTSGLGDRVDSSGVSDVAATVDAHASGYTPGEGRNLRDSLHSMDRHLANLRQELDNDETLSNEERQNAHQAIEDLRQQVQRAATVVQQVDSAIENSNRNLGIDLSINHLSELRRHNSSGRRRRFAGDLVDGWEVSLDLSQASFEDSSADGSGHDTEFSVTGTALIGDQLQVGVTATNDRYTIGGPSSMETQTRSLETYVNYSLTDWLAAGFFLTYSAIDIEDNVITDPILGAIAVGDQFGRWAAGISTSVSHQIGNWDLGLTTSLASTNKRSLERVFDDEDTAWVSLMDAGYNWNDRLSTSVYATYYTLIENDDDIEASFWLFGGSVSYALTDLVSVNIGYETTQAYKDYRENRLNAGLAFSW